MIELQNVTKVYGKERVVDSVDLRVAAGETLVLLGGSGSGKTTTLKMINRLIEPTVGSVSVEGRLVQQVAAHQLRRSIGYVFQELGLFPHMTIEENIGITPKLLGWKKSAITERVRELFKLVELSCSLLPRYPRSLSGGQQQRVAVARALAARPKVLLLDEPFGALDPLTRDRLQASFLRIRDELKLTAVFVTHDVLEGLRLGHRIGVMHQGKLVQVASPGVIVRKPSNQYVQAMMETVARQANDLNRMTEERA